LLLIVSCALPVSVKAADIPQGFQIRPLIVDLNADRGKTYTINVNLMNVTTADLVYKGAARDFKAHDESGTPEVLLNSNLPASSSVAGWISIPQNIAIKSKQNKTFPVTITIPPNAEPGGHYGVLQFSGSAPELESTGVAAEASVGTLLFIRVNGQATESLELRDFFTMRGQSRSSWFEYGPITLVERINNTGNVHMRPTGEVTISNMFGKTVATLKVNEQKNIVLPTSTRRFDQTLHKKWLFGRYTASVSLAYGTQGQVLLGTTSFWVVPYKLIVLILLVLAALVLTIRFFIRRYNAKIIQKALDEKAKNNRP